MKHVVAKPRSGPTRFGLAAACVLALCSLSVPCRGGDEHLGTTADEVLSLGEKMYRTGVLPSGQPMRVVIPGGLQPPGTTFTCAGCHTRSGLGAAEEGGRVPPINAEKLFRPRYPYFPELLPRERSELPERFQTPPVREAYTDITLATAIRAGIDPSGRPLKPVMPRYQLSDRDLTFLVTYLKDLSSRPSPGVNETTLAFATVIAGDVAAADSEAMLKVLDRSIQTHNNLGRNRSGHMGTMLAMRMMGLGYRNWSLARWTLSGPPDTWREQLEAHYRDAPVFALVAGLADGPWEPIHRFCEARRIPCILPITELPTIAPTDYYTLYFSKGFYQEGEAAARYLGNRAEPGIARATVQIVGSGPEAAALARGFDETWAGMGNRPVTTISLPNGTPLGAEALAGLAMRGKNCDLLLWTGPESYDALRDFAAADGPATVVMSSTLLGSRLWELPAAARAVTLVTYPWREPGEKKVLPPMGGRPRVVNKEFRDNDRRIASRTSTVVEMVMPLVPMMERNFYRDYLLDLIDQMEDQVATDYERLTVGPGKRYASDGCYLMSLSEGPRPGLIPRSDWIQQ